MQPIGRQSRCLPYRRGVRLRSGLNIVYRAILIPDCGSERASHLHTQDRDTVGTSMRPPMQRRRLRGVDGAQPSTSTAMPLVDGQSIILLKLCLVFPPASPVLIQGLHQLEPGCRRFRASGERVPLGPFHLASAGAVSERRWHGAVPWEAFSVSIALSMIGPPGPVRRSRHTLQRRWLLPLPLGLTPKSTQSRSYDGAKFAWR